MNMKKLMGLMLASLVATVSLGAEVTTDMARTAMRNWRAQNGTLGLTMGRDVVDARCVTGPGVKFHVVRFAGGGVAITSADTKIRPVIMFSDGSDFDEDPDNPAWDILKADLAAPTGTVRKVALKAAAPTAQPPLTANERAWAELLEEDSLEYSSADAIDDVRVAPLVQTHWAQSVVAGGGRCYNYYTPNNYVCGCVATALAQIMRTFEYPASTTYVAPYTGKYCKVDGETTTLTTQGGYYNWADMPYSPSSSMTETQRQAIGKLTSDVGICLAMQYADGGSGSHTYMAQWVLKNCYGYKSAMAVTSLTSHGVGDDFQRILISNFDAKLPVQIGLSGHSIVGDGYGYDKDGGLWYHLNFGWSNTAPAWYRPPTADDSAQGYSAFAGGVYNIYTERDGKYVIASGRVTDDQGRPVSGKSVSAVAYANPGVVAATATTDENGIYALFVEPGEYLVSVAYEREDGKGIYSGSTAANALKCVSLRIAENAGTYSTPKPAMGNAAFCDIQLVKEDYLTAMLDGLKQNGSAVSLGAGEIGWRTSDGQIGKLKGDKFSSLSGTLTYRLAYSPDDQDASVLRVHDGTLAAEHLTTAYMSQFSSIAAVSKVTGGTLDASAVTAYATPLALGAGVFSLADGEAKTVTVDGTLTLRGGATLRIDATAEGCDTIAATVLDLSGATAMNPFVIDLVNAGASPRDLANGLTLVAVASKTLADGPLANVLVRLDGSDPLQAVIRHGDLVCVSSAAMLDCLKGDGKLVHIDSGYHVKTNSYVTLDTLFGNSTTVQRAFGTFASDSGTANEMELLLYGWSDSKYYAYLGNSKGRKSVCSLPRDTSRHLFEFDALKRAVYVDSTQKGKLDPNYDAATAPSVNALGFFFYNGYTGGMSELNSYQTIYGAQVYEYDAAGVEKSMVGDYVPWRTVVGAVGFYDTVKGEFHGPSASYRDYTAYAPAWNLAYRQFDDTPTVLSLYDGTLAPEHLTTEHMKRFASITAVEKLTDGTLNAGAVTAYATPLTLSAGVFSLADGAAKTVTVNGTLTLRGGATLRIDATAEGCDTIAATAVDLSGATAENPLAIEIEGSGLVWSVPRTVLATGVTGEGVVDCVRVTGGGQPLVAKAVDGKLVVSAFFVKAENVAGHDFTNGVVSVNVEDSSGAKVRLRVTDPVTGESKTTEAREPSADAALAWDLTEAFGQPLTPGRVYSYEVEMVVQDKAVVARTGEFTAANWNVAFGAKVEGVTEAVTGGAWTTKPAVQTDGYTLDDEALFDVHAKTSNGISRVDTKVTFVDVCREADLTTDTAAALGGVTIAERANGATNWMAYTSAGWVTLAGAGAPALDRQYVVRCEIDCLTSPGRLRYSVSSDGGASFATLTANGTAWQPCPDGLTALSKVRFAGSGELAKLESNFADKALAEVGGVKYDTLAEAMAAAGSGYITLLTNVRIVPTQSGSWSFQKGGFDALVDLSKLRNATYSWEGGILKVTCAKGVIILFM